MNIVIEGPDGAGKTTLANRLLQQVNLTYQGSEGPPKFPGEMEERARMYLQKTNTLFDRHPCVSQPIYEMFREKKTIMPQELIDKFYAQGNLIIYVHGVAGAHEAKEHDTKEHLDMIERHDDNIRNAYHEWAQGHANITYSVENGGFDELAYLCQEFLK